MGISSGGAALIAAGVTVAAGAGTTAYTINQQHKAAEEAAANRPGAPPAVGLSGGQSTQALINSQQSLNQQAGSFLTNPAVSNAGGAQRKSMLG
jgi:hypothetical protein